MTCCSWRINIVIVWLPPFSPSAQTPYMNERPRNAKLGSARQRARDVGARPQTAVEQDVDPIAELFDEFRQRGDRRLADFELTAAVIRDDDSVGAELDDAGAVFRVHDTLDHQFTGPTVADRADAIR